jgi:hypothetical protein
VGLLYLIVNLVKKQLRHPHRRGGGLKLLEFTPSASSTLTAAAILAADGKDRGGGLHSDHRRVPLVVHALGK